MVNHCGTCTACCKVFAIAELKKPAGKWCDHCAIGVGCKIYEQRPLTCSSFECLWLMSQSLPEGHRLPAELRPDKTKVVFSPTTDAFIMAATTMPDSPDAWRKKPVSILIKRLVAQGFSVVCGGPADTSRTMIDRDGDHPVRMTEPDEDGMQWNINDSAKEQPR